MGEAPLRINIGPALLTKVLMGLTGDKAYLPSYIVRTRVITVHSPYTAGYVSSASFAFFVSKIMTYKNGRKTVALRNTI